MSKKKDLDKLEEIQVTPETLIIYRAKKPMAPESFALLADYARSEGEKAGVKTLLLPFSADFEVGVMGVDLAVSTETDQKDLEE